MLRHRYRSTANVQLSACFSSFTLLPLKWFVHSVHCVNRELTRIMVCSRATWSLWLKPEVCSSSPPSAIHFVTRVWKVDRLLFECVASVAPFVVCTPTPLPHHQPLTSPPKALPSTLVAQRGSRPHPERQSNVSKRGDSLIRGLISVV